ncbi:MAG TPA: BamA/TamA family outer membrane protein, partial [Cytophagales bacterium]|nr:BamA/TamA family outer membrane protein [Cytophagales bacterium]
MKNWKVALTLSIITCIYGCSTTKSVPQGDALYTGAELKITTGENKAYQKRLNADLQKLIRPKSNKKIFGYPYKLAIYNFIGTPKKQKGLKVTLRRKLGEPPVLYSTVNPSATQNVLSAALFNKGFFHNIVSYTVEEKKRKTKVTYLIHTGAGYRVREYKIVTGDTIMDSIARHVSKPIIKPGRRYNLERIREERQRVDADLKDKGYYYFSPDYLVAEVDTFEQTREVDLYLRVKDNVPEKALKKYKISHSLVVMDSTYVSDSTDLIKDTVYVDNVNVFVTKSFRPKAITRYVYLREQSYYSRKGHQLTLSRLMGMGLFRYVNVDIEERDTNSLSSTIHLAPLPKKSISAEVLAVTKSNNFVGPRVDLNYMNRNFLRGGEKLLVNFHGSVETQINGQYRGLFTYEIGPKVQLSFPHLIVPFKLKPSNNFTPSTNIVADYNFTRRVNYFDMRALKLSLEYKWKESVAKDHVLSPLSVNIFSIRNLSDSFMVALNKDPRMKRRYDDQLVAGVYYSFTYNEQTITQQKYRIYFNGNVDIAGNTASLLSKTLNTTPENGVNTLGGIAYAQYAKFDVDVRNYYHFNKKNQLVGRIMAGWGIPYGNSSALPFIKSFFAGGSNSVRAFSVNSLGPGTYRAPDSTRLLYFLQQGGDIKLEFNVEYRFPIVSVLKGPVFVDAGNTWLSRPSASLP